MFISTVYIRFFRSFNYDYLRKAHPDFKADPWDLLDNKDLQYPFVKVSLEPGVTTVVGANESGKSQLLHAVKRALTGRNIARGDFCRYSQFFAVNKAMAYPDFGLKFKGLDAEDRAAVGKACGKTLDASTDRFLLFRIGSGTPILYLPTDDGWISTAVTDSSALESVLPVWFEIDAHVALPQSVPLAHLAGAAGSLRAGPRSRRQSLLKTLFGNDGWFDSADTLTAAGSDLLSAYSTARQPDVEHDKQLALVDDLLLKVAQIDRTAFQELLTAVESDQDGFANGIVEKMNAQLAHTLNFPKWWSQDNQFQLRMTLRDQDLVFTVRDRTGTEYSAIERSGGLRYFLSYFVQYLAHEPPSSGAHEVLLMDEPDAYLSSTGQQDLLRIFQDFAVPSDPVRRPCQVVYVTHSPFLIDKNHGERLRVLEKGDGDEGTRVVHNAARNHYEPLRSAFGSFVGETTFISTCNLMLEGMSDQILLAGMSARLRRNGAPSLDHLDLNALTLVPAGSASHIPYMVYLARGRDIDRPAVIVLLDSDGAGNKARAALAHGRDGKPLIAPTYVLQLAELPTDTLVLGRGAGADEIEDLIPLEIGVAAVKGYAADFLGPAQAAPLNSLTAQHVSFTENQGTHAALQQAAAALVPGFHLDKVGFARSVMEVVNKQHDAHAQAAEGLDSNFRVLFRELGRRQRSALRELTTEKTGSKIKRLRKSFLQDHPASATREQATLLLEEIDSALDTSLDAEDFSRQIRTLHRDFALDEEPLEEIADFSAFRDALQSLVYREVNAAQER
ncbi:AAA family ATPase [Streptomyces sp. NBC_01477]|uniref:AAA family ATPase n=1 Tax=Streptomyces sp. NBC_01477 TaxID=2976015 RepID=UPI002E2EE2C3|nr:hypothetical protein [Streptomyces sp. NBC_01477]